MRAPHTLQLEDKGEISIRYHDTNTIPLQPVDRELPKKLGRATSLRIIIFKGRNHNEADIWYPSYRSCQAHRGADRSHILLPVIHLQLRRFKKILITGLPRLDDHRTSPSNV